VPELPDSALEALEAVQGSFSEKPISAEELEDVVRRMTQDAVDTGMRE
jgi:DNA-binding NtrC family response regulator